MSISTASELLGMQTISTAVAITLKKMRDYAKPGMSTLELDQYGGKLLAEFGARSAPYLTYGFPGFTCISVNEEVAHGIPGKHKILAEGDLVNIDVSAELNGFWADNGGSFVLGQDTRNHAKLVETSRSILKKAIAMIRPGLRISEMGRMIELSARKEGFRVIRNLTGHGIGRNLHEYPHSVANYYDPYNRDKFRKNMVVAVETFISTGGQKAKELSDGWTLITGDGSFVAQHEHTIVVTEKEPLILTAANEI